MCSRRSSVGSSTSRSGAESGRGGWTALSSWRYRIIVTSDRSVVVPAPARALGAGHHVPVRHRRERGAVKPIDGVVLAPICVRMGQRSNGGVVRPLLICYDASESSMNALEYAAALLPGAPALVVTLWERAIEEALAPAARPPVADPAEAEAVPQRAAAQIAADGTRRASS